MTEALYNNLKQLSQSDLLQQDEGTLLLFAGKAIEKGDAEAMGMLPMK